MNSKVEAEAEDDIRLGDLLHGRFADTGVDSVEAVRELREDLDEE